MHFNAIDLSGQTYGRLTVLRQASNKGGRVAWDCQCDCGRQSIVVSHALRSGTIRSCGCLKVEVVRERMTTHGHAGMGRVISEHNIWIGILKRCDNKNSSYFSRYGGRGITICERWRNFQNFYADMGSRPSPKHSIDRIDNNGHYEPGNCRWATQLEQMENSTAAKKFTINGCSRSISAWSREYGVKHTTVRARLARGLSIEQALGIIG